MMPESAQARWKRRTRMRSTDSLPSTDASNSKSEWCLNMRKSSGTSRRSVGPTVFANAFSNGVTWSYNVSSRSKRTASMCALRSRFIR